MTGKQKRFVDEYLVDLNATQAAIRAGYNPTSAYSTGADNLKKPVISAAIAKQMAERSRRTGVNADRVVRELAKIAFADLGQIIDVGNAAILDSAKSEDSAAIQSIKVKQSVSESGQSLELEVRMADKVRALELLGKHCGLFGADLSRAQLQLGRDKFEFEKSKELGGFAEYEDMEGVDSEVYGDGGSAGGDRKVQEDDPV